MMGIFDGIDQISLDNIDLSEPLAPQNRFSNIKNSVQPLPRLKLNCDTLNRYSLKSIQMMPFSNNEEQLGYLQPQWKSGQQGNPSYKIQKRKHPSSVERQKNLFIYQNQFHSERNKLINEKNESKNEKKFHSEKKAFKIRSRPKLGLFEKVIPKNLNCWSVKMKNGCVPSISEMIETDLEMLKMVPVVDMQVFAMKVRRQEQFRKQKAMENWGTFNYVNAHP